MLKTYLGHSDCQWLLFYDDDDDDDMNVISLDNMSTFFPLGFILTSFFGSVLWGFTESAILFHPQEQLSKP